MGNICHSIHSFDSTIDVVDVVELSASNTDVEISTWTDEIPIPSISEFSITEN